MAPRNAKVRDDTDAASVDDGFLPSQADDADTGTARHNREDETSSRDSSRSRPNTGDEREEAFERPDDVMENWLPPAPLDAPPPRGGMEQRWIRVESGNAPDRQNLSRAKREGWRPREPMTCPSDWAPPLEKHGDQDVIQVEGMVLMERPTKLGRQRKDYFETLRNQQSAAIDESIRRQGDSAGVNIKIKRQSTVTKGRDAVNIQD